MYPFLGKKEAEPRSDTTTDDQIIREQEARARVIIIGGCIQRFFAIKVNCRPIRKRKLVVFYNQISVIALCFNNCVYLAAVPVAFWRESNVPYMTASCFFKLEVVTGSNPDHKLLFITLLRRNDYFKTFISCPNNVLTVLQNDFTINKVDNQGITCWGDNGLNRRTGREQYDSIFRNLIDQLSGIHRWV